MLYTQELEDGTVVLLDDYSEYDVLPHEDENGELYYPAYLATDNPALN